MSTRIALWIILAALTTNAAAPAADSDVPAAAPERQSIKLDTARGDRMIAEYFSLETAKLEQACLADIKSLDDWQARRGTFRQQLFEMLGLDPLPEKTDLKPVVTGTVEHEQFTVEKLHFQSRPGLYVTGNLYVPKNLAGPAPAVLYVCGHGAAKKDGVSYGNKASYQHHGAWFARNGYVCLIIDSLQLGEIEATHHGTYRYGMWWWNSRGYTPAGVEAWNCIRALDYLQSRPEVDAEKIGVTGRSGGGAYSWWVAALDDRVKAAVPVAGITTLRNHVVDGAVEGHCDCMFMVNTYRWDYPQVAALGGPRPLLISNTDKDNIFPLDGVLHVHEMVRRIYRLHDKDKHLGLHITEGPHKDTQELRAHAFVWLNRFLKGEDGPLDITAEKLFAIEQLKVFDTLPADEKNTTIHETCVPLAEAPAPPPPGGAEQWASQRDAWMRALNEKCFRGWPTAEEAGALNVTPAFTAEHDGVHFSAYDFTSQHAIHLRLYFVESGVDMPPKSVTLQVLDAQAWPAWLAMMRAGFAEPLAAEAQVEPDKGAFEALRARLAKGRMVLAFVAPRGIGPSAWDQSDKKQTQHRRRFMLLGQTRDGMQVWDVRRAIQALRSIDTMRKLPLELRSERVMAGVTLYASLYEQPIERLDLYDLPHSHRDGPTFLNVLRFLDTPVAAAMAAERAPLRIHQADGAGWEYVQAVAKSLGWDHDRVQVVLHVNH